MIRYVIRSDAGEIIYLAARQYGRDDLVLLGRGEDEDSIGWRLLKSLQKSVESARRQHVHLVDDKHPVLSRSGRDKHLIHQIAYIVYTIVRCRVKFHYVERPTFVESPAGVTLITRVPVGCRIGAVYRLCKDSRARRLSHTARPAEQICVGKTVGGYRVSQSHSQSFLAYHRVKRRRTVFSCRNYVLIIFHHPNVVK